MKKNIKKTVCIFISLILFFSSYAVESSLTAVTAFVEGCRAYSEGAWQDSVFMLKKAVSYAENNNAETYYMLISAELYANENQSALTDCNYFFENFSESLYDAQVKYLKGRILYNLGEYENAIVELSDFCHQNESHNMYPVALYWIGESLFACEKYDEAQAVFERLILDFPENSKVVAAKFKIESIAQRAREEKLLYLLKQTGEEYLAAKEDYEKQLRIYNSESLTKKKLNEEQQKNRDLEERVRLLEEEISRLQTESDARQLIFKQNAVNEGNVSENSDALKIAASVADMPDVAENKKPELNAEQKNEVTENASFVAVELNPSDKNAAEIADAELNDAKNDQKTDAGEKAAAESVKMLKEKALQAQKFLDSKTEKK